MGNECIMLMLACMSCGAQCARVWVCERAWQRWAGLPTHSIYDIYIISFLRYMLTLVEYMVHAIKCLYLLLLYSEMLKALSAQRASRRSATKRSGAFRWWWWLLFYYVQFYYCRQYARFHATITIPDHASIHYSNGKTTKMEMWPFSSMATATVAAHSRLEMKQGKSLWSFAIP